MTPPPRGLSLVARGSDHEEAGVADQGDEGAVQAFQKGDRAAFDLLVRKYQAQVYRVCYRFTGNHHDANDLAQDIFLRAFRGLDRFRSASRFSTWLYRIAVNCCLNWADSPKLHYAELPEHLPDPLPGVVETISKKELSSVVRAAVAQLPEKQRLTVILRVYHDMPYREIAAVLGCPVGTSKANFYFAIQSLRKAMRKTGDIDGTQEVDGEEE
jgi:RNA polymerase sigma-70 factor (ECF subfamily)